MLQYRYTNSNLQIRSDSMNKQKSLVDNIILMKEWNYEKNGDLKPENFMPNSNKKVWWKCKEGHEWEAVISSRTAGRNCPCGSGRKYKMCHGK